MYFLFVILSLLTPVFVIASVSVAISLFCHCEGRSAPWQSLFNNHYGIPTSSGFAPFLGMTQCSLHGKLISVIARLRRSHGNLLRQSHTDRRQ